MWCKTDCTCLSRFTSSQHNKVLSKISYIDLLGSGESQKGSTGTTLMHFFSYGAGLCGNDALLYQCEHFTLLLTRLLEQRVLWVQNSIHKTRTRIWSRLYSKERDDIYEFIDKCLVPITEQQLQNITTLLTPSVKDYNSSYYIPYLLYIPPPSLLPHTVQCWLQLRSSLKYG